VLYASSGQYDRARTALESAIRTNPTYATAHENLGDIYAKLASQAYDKALQLDSGNVGAKSKLTMVRTLVGNATSAPVVAANNAAAAAAAKKPVTVAAAPAAAAPAPQAPLIIAASTNKPAVAPPPATGVKTIVLPPASTVAKVSTPAPAPAPAVVAKVEPAKVEPAKAAPAPVAKDNGEKDDVLKAVDAWAKAWSNKDVKGYLNMYADNFKTPGGVSMKAWSEERRSRIEGKGRISVKVEAAQVSFEGNSATVRFKQAYSSDRLSSTSRKTLVLEKQGKQWQIKQERTGS
jgi:ketosteroid isomerase-like protein